MFKCSIVVANRYDDLWSKFLENLKAVQAGVEYEVIRVDGNKEGFSYSKAMNEGLSKVKTPFVCFMNDDAYPITENWLFGLCMMVNLGFMASSPIECIGGIVDTSAYPPALPIDSKTQQKGHTSTLNGFCIVAPTQLMHEINGWDETFLHYYEDTDLSIRLEKYGWLCYATRVKVRHEQKVSTKRAKDRDTKGLIAKSEERFLEKWGEDYRGLVI